jgi:cell division protein FtsW
MEAVSLALPWSSGTREQSGIDRGLLMATVVLALVGLIMVFSASAVLAGNRFHDSVFFLKRHLTWLALGFALLLIATHLEYTVWRKLAAPLLVLTGVLLVLVLIPHVGLMAKGARRWIRLGPVSIQPAELAKLTAVLYLAAYLAKKESVIQKFGRGFLPPLIVIGVIAGLILLQPDMGSAVVLGALAMGLLFMAGARMSHLFCLLLVAAPLGMALILGSAYRRQRLMTYLAPWNDPTGAGFQLTQSFLAFGSGGPFGVGLGEGKQKLFFLPEAHTDFVLALVGEELGLLGTSAIIVLFAILVLKGFQIAARAREPFGRHLALGITLSFGLQALINAAVVTGLLPTKGLTLPLVSYGGSSLLVSLLSIGILLSIGRDRQGGRLSRNE